MIFFTRKLYQGYQPNSGWERRAMREWERNREIYHTYRHIISPLLPRSIIRVAGDGLHDSVVTRVTQRNGVLAIEMDTSNSFSRFRPHPLRLTFTGLRRRMQIRELKGQWWLYDEVHLSSCRRFSLHVLFDESELEIEANDVKIERLKARRR